MKNSGCLEIGYGDGITNEEYWPIWDERPDLISTELV